MPWKYTTRGFTGYGPKQKWQDGRPHPDYWGGGQIANMSQTPEPYERRVYDIYPIRDRSSRIDSASTSRSLEIWKKPETCEVSIVATANSHDKSFPSELGHDMTETSGSLPEWIHDDRFGKLSGFDLELANQFNFTTLEGDIPHILNTLANKISQNTNAGVCLQAVFQDMTHSLWPILDQTQKTMTKVISKKPDTKTADRISLAREVLPTYTQRAHSTMIGVSIRGMMRTNDNASLELALEGAASAIGVKTDFVTLTRYSDEYGPAMLKWLDSRQICSPAALEILQNNARMWEDMRWGMARDMVPFLVLDPEELASLLRVPDDPALILQYKRQRPGGAEPTRTGFGLDSVQYGHLVDSPAGLDPNGLLMHTYVLGSTGCGKSSLLRSLLKHLEMANVRGTFESASIFIDIKNRDGIDCYRQCEKTSDVNYIDINDSDFALNLLELPSYTPDDRDATVSRTVGHIIGAFKEIYSQHQTYVQLERVMRLLLHYLYSNTDAPTMLDLYAIIIDLQTGNRSTLERIFQVYNKHNVPEMESSIKALKSMPRDSWTSLINRIEPFVIENFLRSRFATARTTIDFGEMLKPGRITIVRIAEADTPSHVHKLAATVIVMRIWAAVMARQKRGDATTPVVLFLDEFQVMADTGTVRTMLSRARSFGLGLVLAHQNLGQISDSVLDTITGNTSAQIYGRVSGKGASKIARMIEPANSQDLAERLGSQPNYSFIISSMPQAGQERQIPSSITAAPPPQLLGEPPVPSERAPPTESASLERRLISLSTAWMKHIAVHLPTKDEWAIMLALRAGQLSIRELTIRAGISDRGHSRSAIDSLVEQGFVDTRRTEARGRPVLCALTFRATGMYFSGMWSAIGTASDVGSVANAAFEHYAGLGMFVTMAAQNRSRSGNMNADLVAYDYDSALATSVEIESDTEVHSHPEQVIYNMKKWPDMGFARCDVWSRSSVIVRLRDRLDKVLADKVSCYVVAESENADTCKPQ